MNFVINWLQQLNASIAVTEFGKGNKMYYILRDFIKIINDTIT